MNENRNSGSPGALPPLPGAAGRGAGASLGVRAAALAAMLMLYFFAYFQRAAVPGTVFNELQRDFRLSASAVTGLGSAFLYVYAAMQLVAGMAADRYGGRRVLLAGGTVMCVGGAALPFAQDAVVLYATRILIGLGSSLIFLSIVKEVDTLFDRRHFAALMGVVVATNSFASIAATVPLERAVSAWGWRASLGGAGALSVAALAASWLALRPLGGAPIRHTRLPLHLLWDVLRTRRGWPLLGCALINFPVLFCIQAILGKKFLQDALGLPSAWAAGFVLALAVSAAASSLCGGLVLRLTGQRRKPVLIAAPALVLLATLAMLGGVVFRTPPWVFLVAYALLGLAMGYFPASSSTMKELNRPDAAAIAISVLNAAGYAGVAILANVSGVVLDLFRAGARQAPDGTMIYPPEAYAALLAGFAALGLIALLVAVFLVPETRGRAVTLEEIERELA